MPILTERVTQKAQEFVQTAPYQADQQLKAKAVHEKIALQYEAVGIKTELGHNGTLSAFIEGRDSSRLFIVATHGDVVPVNTWNGVGGPFDGAISGGFLHGRGSADMYGGTAAVSEAIVSIVAEGVPETDILHLASADEESNNKHIAELAKKIGRYKEIAVLVPEPTNMEYAGYVHKGQIAVIGKAVGKGDHAATEEDVPNPVNAIGHFIVDTERIHKRWSQKRDSEFGSPTIRSTNVQGVENPAINKITEFAGVTVDARTIPGFHEKARRAIYRIAEKTWGNPKT